MLTGTYEGWVQTGHGNLQQNKGSNGACTAPSMHILSASGPLPPGCGRPSCSGMQVPAELWRFPDREILTGQLINNYLASKLELPDEAIHLLFAANRWEKQ